jgi:hypothetical protein
VYTKHAKFSASICAFSDPFVLTCRSENRRVYALTFLGALFLHSIVERLRHGLRGDYWRSLWTRPREGKGAGWQLLRSLWEQSFFCFNAIADGSWIEIVRPTPNLSRLSRLRASGQTRLPEQRRDGENGTSRKSHRAHVVVIPSRALASPRWHQPPDRVRSCPTDCGDDDFS